MPKADPHADARVRRYYLLQALVAFQLWIPFWSLWLFQRLQGDFFLATLVDVVFWVVSLLVAMPAGAFADRFGRKPALLLGVGLWSLGIVLFGASTTLPAFAFANGVWAIGAGFLWGAGTAYLYDTLTEVRLEDRYPAMSSRVTMYAYLGTAAAAVLGGALVAATLRLDLTLLLYALPGIAALVVLTTFREPTVAREPEPSMGAQIRRGLRTTAGNRQIVYVIAFQVLVGLVGYIMSFFRPQFLDQVVQGDYALMGAVYAGFFCIAAVAGRGADRLLRRFGEFGGLLLVFLLTFPPFALVYAVGQGVFAPDVALVLGVLTQVPYYVMWGIEAPVMTTILNRRVASRDRATVLAINSFFATLAIAFAEPIVGLVATDYNVGMGLGIAAFAASIPAAYMLIAYHRSEREGAVGLPAGASGGPR